MEFSCKEPEICVCIKQQGPSLRPCEFGLCFKEEHQLCFGACALPRNQVIKSIYLTHKTNNYTETCMKAQGSKHSWRESACNHHPIIELSQHSPTAVCFCSLRCYPIQPLTVLSCLPPCSIASFVCKPRKCMNSVFSTLYEQYLTICPPSVSLLYSM